MTPELATPEFWVAAVQIVIVNILLSGDNAVVIALACRNLPPKQRRWGVFWGAFG
ncbi:MAG: TerC family protein, partial [Casimicrobiaceae bacterium]